MDRYLKNRLITAATRYPITVVQGPIGSGKSHLVQSTLRYEYVSMEDPDIRDFARNDPWNFLYRHYDPTGSLIIDEVQLVPPLLTYIQKVVDKKPFPGSFILTSSTQLPDDFVGDKINRLTLLPLSIRERIESSPRVKSLDDLLFDGCLPQVASSQQPGPKYYSSLIHSFVEKVLPKQLKVDNTDTFHEFMRKLAGRVGQTINFSRLGDEVGVCHNTARAWISLLEKNYFVHFLYPSSLPFGKRIVKTPKLYFMDTGVACALLGIRSSDQLSSHYLRSELFESLIITDLIKQNYYKGVDRRICFWRDKLGNEIDCLLEDEQGTLALGIKPGKTVMTHHFESLQFWKNLTGHKESCLVFGGEESVSAPDGLAIGWTETDSIEYPFIAKQLQG